MIGKIFGIAVESGLIWFIGAAVSASASVKFAWAALFQ